MHLPGPATTPASARALHPSAPRPSTLDSSILEDIARGIAAGLVLGDGPALVEPTGCLGRHPVLATEAYDAWIMVWGPRSTTGAHDHDGSVGVVHVLHGGVTERVTTIDGAGSPRVRVLRAGDTSATGAIGTHELTNETDAVAIGVTVYSPPLRGRDAG